MYCEIGRYSLWFLGLDMLRVLALFGLGLDGALWNVLQHKNILFYLLVFKVPMLLIPKRVLILIN